MAAPQRIDDEFNNRYDSTEKKFGQSFAQKTKKFQSQAGQDNIRNIRTSSMPGSPRNQDFVSSKRDIATDFNASYAKAGIQPQSANEDYYKPAKRKDNPNIRAVQTTYHPEPRPVPVRRRVGGKLKLVGGKKSIVSTGRSYAKANAVNMGILSWGLPSYIFQLLFATLSLVFLSLAGLLESVTSTLTPDPDGNYIVNIVKSLAAATFKLVGDAALAIVKAMTGIDLALFSPKNVFMVTHTIVFMFGVAVLLTMYFIYTFSLLKPLSGKKEGAKYGALLVCMIGYSLPILNLVPWFLVWLLIVWRYPK